MNNTTRNVAATLGRLTLAAMFSAVCLGAAVMPATAGTPDDMTVQTRLVSTAGLDLTRSHDQAVLMRRLAVAARQVCRKPASSVSESASGYEECVQSAMYFAHRQANAAIALAAKTSVVASAEK